MKVTKRQLRRIIREEARAIHRRRVDEGVLDFVSKTLLDNPDEWGPRPKDELKKLVDAVSKAVDAGATDNDIHRAVDGIIKASRRTGVSDRRAA